MAKKPSKKSKRPAADTAVLGNIKLVRYASLPAQQQSCSFCGESETPFELRELRPMTIWWELGGTIRICRACAASLRDMLTVALADDEEESKA